MPSASNAPWRGYFVTGAHITLLAERNRTTLYIQRDARGPVLLKVLNEDNPTPEELVRFLNDLEMTRELSISGVRRGLHRSRLNGRHTLVLEYVPGEALGRKMVESEADLVPFLSLAIQIARILGAVHEQGIIHRDVKPENLIFDSAAGAVTLIDFGISSRIDLQTQHLGNPAHLEGTLAYIAPEQTGRMNRVVDYRADLYSLGASLYQLLTGQPPFVADDPMQLVHCHLARLPEPPHLHNPVVPEPLSLIVLKLLAKDAADRYQSAFGLAHDLQRCRSLLQESGRIQPFALAQQDFSGRFRLPQKLYGRERELQTLMEGFRVASRGGVEMVLVSGYAGVGKSALIREVHKPVTETHGYFIQGKFDLLQRRIPYYAPLQAFDGLVDILLTEGEERLGMWARHILDAVGGLGGVLATVVPAITRIIGPQPPAPALSGDEARNRLDYVIRAFIRAIGGPTHPLVLFIDDLHWADQASLDLIEALMTDPMSSHILFIGAYRDNEVTPGHPLETMLGELRKQGGGIRHIELSNLSPDDLGLLVGDALGVTPELAAPLAEMVEEKTGGNAFAVAQCLTSIHESQALWFDFASRRWHWDMARIRELDIPANVVELLAGRIRKLGPEVQHALQLAACIGNRFDLEILSLVHERSSRDTLAALWPAITERLVIPTGNTYRLLGAADMEAYQSASFRFAHDRIQQAVYSLLDEAQRQAMHARIGRLLQQRRDGRQHLFDIVNHLDLAADLLDDAADRQALAALNLEAGRLAQQAAAYGPALGYLQMGMRLLPEDRWTRAYELTLALYSEASQAAYSVGDLDLVNVLAVEVLAHARTVLDTLDARNSMLRSAASRDSLTEVLELGLDALASLGVTFPARPTMASVMAAYLRTRVALLGRSIESLADAPEMSDRVVQAAVLIIERMVPAAFRSGTMLFPLLVLRLVSLSLAHGNAAASVYGYGSYAIMLCGVMRKFDEGYRVGKMSLRLADKLSATPRMGDALFIYNVFVRHWKEPLRRCVKPMQRAHQLGLESGRSFEAASAGCYYLMLMQASGSELAAVERELQTYNPLLERDEAGYMGRLVWQLVDNLLGRNHALHDLSGARHDEDQVKARFAAQADKTEAGIFYTYKVQLCFLAGEHEAAVAHADEAEAYLEGITGMTFEVLFRFYSALARLAVYRSKRGGEPARRELLRSVRKTRSLLGRWAKHGPDNYLHKYLLLEAEHARARGRRTEARGFYDQAVDAARASKILPEEALALELASDFYQDAEHPVLADAFLHAAVSAYGQWGAEAKVRMLRARSLQPVSRAARGGWEPGGGMASTEPSRTTDDGAALDLISLMKASRAISAEIVMERLLAGLIEVVIENAGAQQGALLLWHDGELRVQAQGGSGIGAVSVLQGTPLTEARGMCQSLIRYVARVQEYRVVEDAGEDERFRQDPHVRDNGVRAMLALPIMHQGQLVGVLYLENNLTAGAFTPASIEVLQVLASQAAVSIQNARLYGSQVELAQALRRFVPDEFLRSLGRESIAEVRLGDSVQKEMTILFSDIRRFTSLVEGMGPEENIHFINRYLHFMEPCIERHGGFVDSYVGDAIMALFEGHADRAIRAAVEMLRSLETLNEQRRKDAQPAISVGVGINSGLLTLGTIGGARRIKCGVIGDSVNLASRVESQTKRYDIPLLISDQTYSRLRAPSDFHIRMVDRVRVVGRSEPVTLYEVFDADDEERRQAKLAVADSYAEALALYYRREFTGAERLLRECLRVLGEDSVVASFLERCQLYRDTALDQTWTGVEDLRYK